MNLMKEMTKQNKFAHKNDLWQYLASKMNYQDFNRAMDDLQNDGAIYSTINNDCFSITS